MKGLFSAEPSPELNELWKRLVSGSPTPNIPGPLGAAMRELYGPLATPSMTPFVIAQMGQSLDGYIATESGASHYVTGPESLIHLHRLRALCDAVIVGWRTVEADDPQLSVRHVNGENPLRVVIDIEGKLSADHKMFSKGGAGALRLTGPGVPALGNVESESVALTESRAEPQAIIELLRRRGCKNILVEGGGALVSSFLTAGALDRLHLVVAPLFIGRGRRGIALPAVKSLQDALRLKGQQYDMGNDVLFDFDLQ